MQEIKWVGHFCKASEEMGKSSKKAKNKTGGGLGRLVSLAKHAALTSRSILLWYSLGGIRSLELILNKPLVELEIHRTAIEVGLLGHLGGADYHYTACSYQ